MNQDNLTKYLSSMVPVKRMLTDGLISEDDYKKSERLLAKKYCIKDNEIYRLNELLLLPFRVMYVCDEKEVNNGKQSSLD